MSKPDELTVRLRKGAVCVYLAAEKGPADDLSDMLSKAADTLDRLTLEVKLLEMDRDNWRAKAECK